MGCGLPITELVPSLQPPNEMASKGIWNSHGSHEEGTQLLPVSRGRNVQPSTTPWLQKEEPRNSLLLTVCKSAGGSREETWCVSSLKSWVRFSWEATLSLIIGLHHSSLTAIHTKTSPTTTSLFPNTGSHIMHAALGLLCGLSWPWTCDLPPQLPKHWDYREAYDTTPILYYNFSKM